MATTGKCNSLDRLESWMKHWFPQNKLSRKEMELLLRGPMKDIVGEFLQPKCIPSQQMFSARSNLYVQRQGNAPVNIQTTRSSEEVKLEKQLKELTSEKQQQLCNLQEESKTQAPTALEGNVKSRHLTALRDMISCTDELISDLSPLLQTGNMVVMERTKTIPIQKIEEECIELFRKIFFDESSDENDLHEMNKKVHNLITKKVYGGLQEKEIVVWHKNELEKAFSNIQDLKAQCTGTGLEAMKNKAKKIKMELLKQHVALHDENTQLEQEASQLHTDNVENMMNMVRFDPSHPISGGCARRQSLLANICPQYLQEELKYKIRRSKEQRENLDIDSEELSSRLKISKVENEEVMQKLTTRLLQTYKETRGKLVTVKNERPKYVTSCLLEDIEESLEISDNANQEEKESRDEELVCALNPNNERLPISFAMQYQYQNQCQQNLGNNNSLLNLVNQLESVALRKD